VSSELEPTGRVAHGLSTGVAIGPVRKKRSSLDLIADMIEAAKGGARQTAIMYGANLSYDLLVTYLPVLQAKRLLEAKDTNGLIFPSQKGLRYLREYRSYRRTKDGLLSKQHRILSLLE